MNPALFRWVLTTIDRVYYMKMWRVVKKSFPEYFGNNPLQYSSSISFYLMFSLPAILLILINLVGIAFEDQTVRTTILNQVEDFYGNESAGLISEVIKNSQDVGSTWYAKILGTAMLIFSSTAVFSSMQNSLNSIWNIKPKPDKDFLNFLKNRLLSFGVIISMGFIMVVFLVLDTGLSVFKDYITQQLSGVGYVLINGINSLLSIVMITITFGVIYTFLPDAKIKLKRVIPGAFVAAILFTVGKFGMGIFLSKSSLSTAYGSSGALVMLLVWVFYSTSIVLFGASFSSVLAKESGSKIEPYGHAVIVKEVEVE